MNSDQRDTGQRDTDERDSGEEALALLFSLASRRQRPPEEDERRVREALQEEWVAMTRAARWRRRSALALAALLVLAVSTILLRNEQATSPRVQVATLERTIGTVSTLGNDPEGRSVVSAPTTLYVGQTLITGPDARYSLRWHSGPAVRVDEESHVRLLSETSIELLSGRLYVDLEPEVSHGRRDGSRPSRPFSVTTAVGAVRHLGTQYMAKIEGNLVVISVREGSILMEGPAPQVRASAGQQVSVNDRGQVNTVAIERHGGEWSWVEDVVPPMVLDGKRIADFLERVARETGLKVEYRDHTAEAIAREETLHGVVDLPPRRALQVVLLTTDLQAQERDGVIQVSSR